MTLWIIPIYCPHGNHPHCPQTVSWAPSSSLKNICFTASVLENVLTVTLTRPLLPGTLSFYWNWGSLNNTSWRDRMLKTSQCLYWFDSYLWHTVIFQQAVHTFTHLSAALQQVMEAEAAFQDSQETVSTVQSYTSQKTKPLDRKISVRSKALFISCSDQAKMLITTSRVSIKTKVSVLEIKCPFTKR